MNITLSLGPLVSLLAGALILVVIVPRLLNCVIAAYLIVIGWIARAVRRHTSEMSGILARRACGSERA